jgi:membrane protein
VVATIVWLVASGGFAVYTSNFARYSKTYGSLGSIVVVLLWLYLSAFAVLIGAETDGVLD